jgi:NitT/TauT family transport system substrate-binding protein
MLRRSFAKWLVLLLLGWLTAAYIAACNSQSSNVQSSNSQPSATPSSAAKPLVVATSPWVGFRGQYIAAAKDFFKAEGITVSEQPFQAATDVNTALAAGKVDLAWTGGADLLTLATQIPSVKVIMASDYSNGGDGILGRNITSPADLKGKKVAREDAPYAIVFLGTYLAKAGLTEKDLNIVPLAAGDAMTAFVAGKVDAATTYEPWLSKAKNNIIFTSKNTSAIPIVLATKAELIQTRRDDILKYLKSIDNALKYAASHPQEADEIAAKSLGVSPAEVPAQLAGIHPFDIATNKSEVFNPNHPLYLVKSLDTASQTLYSLGKIPQQLDASKLVDDSLINTLATQQ